MPLSLKSISTVSVARAGRLLPVLAVAFSQWPGAAAAADSPPPEPFFSPSEIRLIGAFGPWPPPTPPDPGNELSGEPVAESLGQRLFNDADLSASRKLSCASCHQPHKAFSDGTPVAIGAQRHVRNTQGLLDSGLQRWFGWDGGSDSQWAAALRPMLSTIEMAGDIDTLANRLRDKAYFNRAIARLPVADAGQSNEMLLVTAAKAIAAYTRTLRSAASPFDRFRDRLLASAGRDSGDYPAAAARGLKIFLGDANCHVCHFGANFSNSEFHDTGRPFFTGVGQVDSGRYSGVQRVRQDRYNLNGPFNGTRNAAEIRKTSTVKLTQAAFGQWRTPSLRNLIHTAPYTHDGSLATLREVVDWYADINPERLHSNGEALLKPLALSAPERQDLVAFLESLSAPLALPSSATRQHLNPSSQTPLE